MSDGTPLPRRFTPFTVAAAFFAVALVGLGTLPLFDPDEAYYPATARESLAAGDPLDLRLNGAPRWEKPPLAYALQAAAFAVAGPSEAAARLPSVLAAAALVWILGATVSRVAGTRAGAAAAATLATSLGFAVLGRAAHPEVLLVLGWTTAYLLAALAASLPPGTAPRWWVPVAALSMGAGFLAKGPFAVLFPLLAIAAGAALSRGGRDRLAVALRALATAAAAALVVAAPWFLWMGARHGDSFWRSQFAQFGHATSASFEKEYAHPLYFVAVLPAAFLPWIGLLPEAIRGLSREDRSPRDRFALLMVCGAAIPFAWFSAARAQLPHYALSMLPPLAALVGMRLADLMEGRREGPGRGLRACAALLLAPAAAAAAAAAALPGATIDRAGGPGAVWPLVVGLAAAPAAATWLVARGAPDRLPAGVLLGATALAAVAVPVASGVDAALRPPLRAWGEAIRAADPAGEVRTAVYRRRYPSLSFYARRVVERIPDDPAVARRFGATAGPRFLVVHARHEAQVRERVFGDPAGGGGNPPGWTRVADLPGVASLWRSTPPGGGSPPTPGRAGVPPEGAPR